MNLRKDIMRELGATAQDRPQNPVGPIEIF